MKVRITKAFKSTYWYADKIGEAFEVVQAKWSIGCTWPRSQVRRSWCLKDNSIYLIGKSDCEVVKP